jgi:DNA-binding NtrC family response regulator
VHVAAGTPGRCSAARPPNELLMKILVVDHEKVNRANLADKLAAHGHEPVTVADGQDALERLLREPFDVVFADAKVPRIDGVELLRRIKQSARADTPVVIMSSNGSIPVAVQAVKLGALDFLKKPIPTEKLRALLSEIGPRRLEPGTPRKRTTAQTLVDIDREIIGSSPAIERVKRLIRIAAQTDANVLIHGETGVGKDLVASVIHGQSHRAEGPYVKVGCTLLPPSLIESELYGHEEGSFTGADQHRRGRFEMADGGTIYLDDVDDISVTQQAKLLRAIEEKVFERVGGTKLIKANVRIVAATKVNLLDKVADGTFRQDLYYRLDVLRVRVPPLRARLDDIPALTAHLLRRIAGDAPCTIEDQAIEVLSRHRWPGNVRELRHALERAWLVGGGQITAEFLANDLSSLQQDDDLATTPLDMLADPSKVVEGGGFRAAMDAAEKQLLIEALRASGGNKTAAATALGMKPSTFRDKLVKHALQ